jgi:hypothetical protein
MRQYYKYLILLLFLLDTAQAQTPDQNRTSLLREANADGALIALALHCKHSTDDVNRLGDKLEALALARAKEMSVALDSFTYHEVARDGFMHMREVLAVAIPGDDSNRTQCAEAAGKISKVMAQ